MFGAGGGSKERSEEVLNLRIYSFKEWSFKRPVLDGIDFQNLNSDDNAFLVAPFTEEEKVKEEVWSCVGNKC